MVSSRAYLQSCLQFLTRKSHEGNIQNIQTITANIYAHNSVFTRSISDESGGLFAFILHQTTLISYQTSLQTFLLQRSDLLKNLCGVTLMWRPLTPNMHPDFLVRSQCSFHKPWTASWVCTEYIYRVELCRHLQSLSSKVVTWSLLSNQ